ncbi:L-threonylcarbamoyladenylate synthase [Oxalobacter aliiformigenes]|uniref:L-threonylcarbamoyladenylate synthase n=1 Tax=Oxalobacter aliiformigenes TaxID=2946593 RepID=A0ABY7JG78_9BURK|nr:L-threonylcarbamoyladenylate synthase [Oxalobacter aliiformigenes]WAV92929.1 L-threonylcarbamoyladenylate synthase [Oxalobacter aliiformigenes]WAV95568.1 L-threonylcarbamoyladenylate synthase [Oxalobacter aliiformigenes]WAV96638.1 L-threonylcarbamoyladenylate synthase [Oxalobacter aliiformigenes]
MTSFYLEIHPVNPQIRLIRKAADIVRDGGVIVIPTDSSYALVCRLDDKAAVDRIRQIRQIDERHLLTLLCRDLSEVGSYARVDNSAYRLLKTATPGAFTFILQATKEVPRRLSHPSRKTIGLRVPDNRIDQALLKELGEPLICTTVILPGDEDPMTEGYVIQERLEKLVDAVVDGGACGLLPTTVVDLTGKEPLLVRSGRGEPALIGL